MCSRWGPRSGARLHIGAHALELAAAACSLATEPKQPLNLCGSCGASPTCEVTLALKGDKSSSYAVSTRCAYPLPYFHYKPALSISLLEATANIPILCPLCNATIWRRNAQHHFGVAHVGVALPPALDLTAAAGSRDKLLAGVGKVAKSAVRAIKKSWHIGSEPTFAGGSAGVVIGVRGAGGMSGRWCCSAGPTWTEA